MLKHAPILNVQYQNSGEIIDLQRWPGPGARLGPESGPRAPGPATWELQLQLRGVGTVVELEGLWMLMVLEMGWKNIRKSLEMVYFHGVWIFWMIWTRLPHYLGRYLGLQSENGSFAGSSMWLLSSEMSKTAIWLMNSGSGRAWKWGWHWISTIHWSISNIHWISSLSLPISTNLSRDNDDQWIELDTSSLEKHILYTSYILGKCCWHSYRGI